MINKEKLGLFIVMFSLLFFIIKLHKKHFEQFRLLNCDLSKEDTKLSDENFICCEAKNFLEDHDEQHPSYLYYKNVSDQCNKISTIDISHDAYMMSDHNARYDSLEVILNNLENEYQATLKLYNEAEKTLEDLENAYARELNIYNSNVTESNLKTIEFNTYTDINSNLIEMSEMHEYKIALSNLEVVINNSTLGDMGILRKGLNEKEDAIQNQIQESLNKALSYIPNLTDLYIHNVRLFESIEKTRTLKSETHAPSSTSDLNSNIEKSQELYENSITLLNLSETTLYTISESIKDLSSNYLYQTGDNTRNFTIYYKDEEIELTFVDDKYILPASIILENRTGGEYISEFLFKQCRIDPIPSCGKLPRLSPIKEIEEDIAQEYKKQTEDITSTFFSTFLRYMRRDNIITDSIINTNDGLDKTFAYAFLLKTFPPVTGSQLTSVDQETSP